MLFTVPSRYSALSVAVCSKPWAVVRPASHRMSRVRRYSSCHPRRGLPSAYGALTRSGAAFQSASAQDPRHAGRWPSSLDGLATPLAQRRPPWHASGLGCSRFARRYYGDTLSSSGYVRCFSSPGALRTVPCGHRLGGRVAPFGNRRINARRPLPSAYRSAATSFIGTQRLGIPQSLILSSVPEPEYTDSGLGNVMHLVRYVPRATRSRARRRGSGLHP